MWESSGWITSADPYGWFQWYCRFYLGKLCHYKYDYIYDRMDDSLNDSLSMPADSGRRCSDDERQIARGLGVIGPKGRWRNNLINKIINTYPSDLKSGLEDESISPVVRQLLLHWGYQLTLKDLENANKLKKK